MAKRVMAVYDGDPLYTEGLAEFVNRKEQVPFSVMGFTALEGLKAYGEDNRIELLLVDSSISREEIEKIGAAFVVMLADGEAVSLEEQYPSVYKYQAADRIMREVMEYYCDSSGEQGYAMVSKTGRVMGVYSPINRCLKTSFALTMGQLLARDLKVLYLNFEDCSGFRRLMGEEYKGGMSDLLYYYTQEGFRWGRLGAVVHTWGDLDYVPPVQYPEDLCQVTGQMMAEMVSHIARESTYGSIILDLGQFGKKGAELLEVCDVVYMPVKDDCVSAAKVEEFEEYLASSGHGALKSRIQKIKPPYHSSFGRRDNYLEQLLWGELGDYTRQLLRKYP
ncbi:P-loop NTPase family protein [Lacrimispora brassicae]